MTMMLTRNAAEAIRGLAVPGAEGLRIFRRPSRSIRRGPVSGSS